MNHQRRMALGLLALGAVAFLLSRAFPTPTPPPDTTGAPLPVAQPSRPPTTAPPPSDGAP